MTITFSFTYPPGHDIEIEWFKDGVLVVNGVFDGVTVSGATTTTLTVTDPTAAWDGIYFARVTDHTDDCVTDSNPVDVVVPATCRLELTVQPVDVDTSAGNNVQFTIAYTGATGAVTFQWYKDGVALEDGASAIGTVSGALTDTLLITAATADAAGSYYVILVDDGIADCSVQSDAATATVSADCDLLITVQPESQTLVDGEELMLTFAYTGSGGPFTVQWYRNGVPLTDGVSGSSTIAGATTTTLTITAWTSALAGSYTAIVIDTSLVDCQAQTGVAAIFACDLAIDAQPSNTGYFENEMVELTVTTTGGAGPLTYQWYRNGVALVDGPQMDSFVAGATTATLTITNTDPQMAGEFHVVITDTGTADCEATSEAVNVFMLLLSENFEGSNPPVSGSANIFDNTGWFIATSVGGSNSGNITTPICDTCSLRMVGGTLGQDTDARHDVSYLLDESWVHIRVRVNILPVNDTPVLRLSVDSSASTPASGNLRVVLRTAANGQVVQVTSPGATDVDTVAQYPVGTDFHIWAYYNASTGAGWVKFSTTGVEPGVGDNMASYTGGSTSQVQWIWLQTVDTPIYDFDTVRWANFTIGDIEC